MEIQKVIDNTKNVSAFAKNTCNRALSLKQMVLQDDILIPANSNMKTSFNNPTSKCWI